MSERASVPKEEEETEPETEQEPVTTGAQSVIRALENAETDYVFGVQGGAIMPVYDALYDSDINHVTMAHEQGASHAADAYGVVTGDPGVCFATSGPGATNLVTGIADANMDSDPVIALTGQVPTEFVGNDAFQETDTVGITQPITKESYFAADSDTVGDDVSEAFALADAGRQGPTLVDLPKDVTQGETEVEPGSPETPETYEVPEEADDENVQEAAEALAEADRPVILSGGGVIKADASSALREFAKEYEIPVITTMPGIGSFPEDHELSLEWAGMHGTGYANMAISNTDCMLAIGTRFDDRLTGGVDSFAPDAEVIHVDIDPAEISKNVYADYPLIGDARNVLRQLFDAMPRAPDADEWRDQCQTWKDEYPMDYDTPDDEPLKPQYVVEQFSEMTPDDTIVCTGVGQHQMWASQFWEYTEPRTWVSSHGLGTMGYGVPAAIGAKLAAPDQEVVCFDGDGSFLMTVQGLSVAVREQLDITYVVLNNEAVGMVRQWQDGFYEGRRMASEYPWIPQFDKLAEAFGARGFTLESYDNVEETIQEARDYDGPSVIDAHIDPGENVFPMVPSGGDNGQFALNEDHLDMI
ncbi:MULTISPECIES: biosynthetic-type acetolactate synthase large subunit [Haloarcula]|uniref:Acetolactate synthase n=2 Tax=Haloarcula marismortui TaxID=2238 RepID=Q5V522_HALMA|nr:MULTISPECIES: biosynthetic-type acetolactate synthase large subunit [Haloarcula]AAV45380.1 acetolactate synthase large subunit [Haloarcula marismortui ATCC 43049]EMA13036.1 acetolactate synthase large subunit [Haloarcula sinaiiensis ATCC 33800]NHX38761.1 biosynthetic-type acetolactate synthase large subunit [Haloarcula sp. R1-2]QCP93156.1 biosynthetic-type acetolactate synthase large subunit [Haloarcula marismortui ATCC 43049]QUJ70703.1 biosynthetic-type acetolactate synthase large subunit 